jgi:hypothetical protein
MRDVESAREQSLARDSGRNVVQPIDIIGGIGAASRQLLCASLALFDDSTFGKRLQETAASGADWVSRKLGGDVAESAASIQSRIKYWHEGAWTEDELRLVLFMYLRNALHLEHRLSASMRGLKGLAEEIAAAVVRIGCPSVKKDAVPEAPTLDTITQAVLKQLLEAALKGGEGQMGPEGQDQLISDARRRLEELGDADRQRLLNAVGAKELNDEAVRKILLGAGGLGAFSAAVGASGFAAYILAAQASAFIPLVSGPALVSVVAVLSNPITVAAAGATMFWWASTSVNDKVRAAVAVRVASLLALNGLAAGRGAQRRVLIAFGSINSLRRPDSIREAVLAEYLADWALLNKVKAGEEADSQLARVEIGLDQPINVDADRVGRWRKLLPGTTEVGTTGAIAGLTLGDILYSAASIDPAVMAAADFSRVPDLSNTAAFAAFADEVLALQPASELGATMNLKGYVGEQIVAAQLLEQGHQVVFPSTSNQPGWDLMVDGEPFQVKCFESASSLAEHFDKYPDIPVLANAELAGNVPADCAGKVFFVEGYSDESVTELTTSSLNAGADLAGPDVPMFAMLVVGARNLGAYAEGKVSARQAFEETLLDGTARAGLAVAGGFAGKGVGLLLLGPAGAIVLGSVVPVLAQVQSGAVRGAVDGLMRTERYRRWEKDAQAAVHGLELCLERALSDKLKALLARHRAMPHNELGSYCRARVRDDVRYLSECRERLRLLSGSDKRIERRALDLIAWTARSTVHPIVFQGDLSIVRDALECRPTLRQRTVEVVSRALDSVRRMVKGGGGK